MQHYGVIGRKVKQSSAKNGFSGFSHVGLAVVSLEQTYDNFFKKLGWEKIGGDKDYPSIFISDGECIITLWQIPNKPSVSFDRKTNVGLHHIALKIESKEKLFELHEKVKSIGDIKIEFEPQEIPGFGWWHFICYEPGGIRVEFTWHGPSV